MDTSDSSDDDKDFIGRKQSKLKIVDVAENDDNSSTEEKDVAKSAQVSTKASKSKKRSKPKQRQSRPKQSSTSGQPRKKTAQTGLNGNYWNVVRIDRHAPLMLFNRSQQNDSDKDTASFSEKATGGKHQSLKHSSSSSSLNDSQTLLYSKRTFVTCRSPADAFFLCQVLQDVYSNTRKIRIRWCALADENGDETKVDETTRFKFDYEDTLELQTILTGVSKVIHHSDKTISLSKEDIAETQRLLKKSIEGGFASSDEPIDVTNDDDVDNASDKIMSDSSDADSLAIRQTPPKIIKRKISPDNSRKSPDEKRIRKASGEPAAPITKRRRTQDIAEISEGEKPPIKKPAAKPIAPTKAQLFKVQSNRFLKANLTTTNYVKDPFFEDTLHVPFISTIVHSKLAIRAVLTNNVQLLKSLINDTDRVCSVHVQRGLHNDLTAIHYSIRNDNIEMLKILIGDLKNPQKHRCPFPKVSMMKQSTGSANTYTFGFRTIKILAARGAKEGNNALNKDSMEAIDADDGEDILEYAIKNNCSRKIYDILLEAFPYAGRRVYDKVFQIVRSGHRKLAASIIGDIKDNQFYGFNYLHHQVLLYDNEELTINRAESVMKKARDNFNLTPIHCAAINPNSKYLKRLLDIMPEYNLLDKYERRPIHFAAACEGPEPLEYLLSKKVNFNDVDRGGNSPLHIAVMNGRAINAEIVLRTAKEKAESNDPDDQITHQKFGLASINRMNKSRFYPLHLAVLNNHLECVKVLLEFGANIDALTSTSSGKLTSLMLACQKGYYKIVRYLVENDAKVEARDRFKRTPLIHACMCGNAHVVSYLLRMGANANVFDSSLNTALHYAVSYGWYFCVRLLIEAGANINAANSWQTTCLAAGFLKGHYGLCDYLLNEHNVDINFKTDDGLSLVMLTASLEISSSSQQQLEYIVTKHKADCTSLDVNGSNAFHYLASNTTFNKQVQNMDTKAKSKLRDCFLQMAQILLNNKCDPNKMNNKAQSPLMVALESRNFVLADYLINTAKVEINSDISYDGKTLLHYFANQCNEYELMQTLTKIPISDEIKKMGQMFDNFGRTPLHYCSSKFNQFCQQNKSSQGTEELTKQYQSIVDMIEYCLISVGCDPDVGVNTKSASKPEGTIEDKNDKDETLNENIPSYTDDIFDEDILSKHQETVIFSLLRTVPFIENTIRHPLEIFLKKVTNINVLHHETQRTPLLEAIILQEVQTTCMLIKEPSCDITLSTSTVETERKQTPFILACKLHLLPVVRELLNHKQCNILAHDYRNNQAIHYFLSTPIRSNQYLDVFNEFIEKLKLDNGINGLGESDSTPLHVAVYHNSGNLDSTTDMERLLIENGGDLFAKDKLGNMPLHNVFINKNVGDDPVELCVLITNAMKPKSLDAENNDGNTALHLAVAKCSTVCVMLLQQDSSRLYIKNKLSNTIIGTCIASGHLHLFISFLRQSDNLNLDKLHTVSVANQSVGENSEETSQTGSSSAQSSIKVRSQINRKSVEQEEKSIVKSEPLQTWYWKYVDVKADPQYIQRSLIYLIIEKDWQGPLSLILNEVERFHLTIIGILEAAILNNKLNLVQRLLMRIKGKDSLHERNVHEQNLFHLLANMNEYDANLLEQILLYIHEHNVEWNLIDRYGSYPIHYACVKQNFIFINFFREKYPADFHLNQTDAFQNTAVGLLFWSIAMKTSFANEQIRSLIQSSEQLNCLCNYDNEIAMNPLSFGYVDSSIEKALYPPKRSSSSITIVRTSPLIHAIVHNNFDLVKFLLQLHADVNFPDEEKRTPLMHAVRQNNIDIVKLLLNKDYVPIHDDSTSNNQSQRIRQTSKKYEHLFLGATTTTSTYAYDKSPDILNESEEFKVTSSVNLNMSDSLGRTCIHHLVQPFPDGSYTSNIELLRLLHSAGASLTKYDLAGLSPLQYGAINGCQHLCDELTKLTKDTANSTLATIEHFYINDPNKNLLDQPDFYSDAQQLIDKYIVKHPSRKQNAAYEVDRLSGMTMTGEVLIDTDKNEPYDAHLTRIDVSYGIYGLYNFYHMQIIKHKSKNSLYFLFTRWGRIGEDGQYQLTPYSILDECRKEFLKIFREKTGNHWKDTNQFESKAKKHTLVQLNQRERYKYASVKINFKCLQSEETYSSSKLQSPVFKDFLKTLINPQAIRANIVRTELDVEWMPASQLSRSTLQKACDLLVEIKKLLEKRQKLKLEMQHTKRAEQPNELKSILETIYKYTNEYYAIVPLRGYADEKLTIIDNENILKKQEKILHDLLELELSYKILLGAQFNLKYMSPLDYLYKSMNCQFEAMNKDDIDSQLILRYIWASSSNTKVEQIFKVARPNEDERLFKSYLDNHYLLWHGTDICNLISILTRGLLVTPLSAATTGSLFGKGIYTADTFAKSLNYCSGIKDGDGEHCFMILCEVALGKIKESGPNHKDDDDNKKPLDPDEFQSRKGIGRHIPDPRYTITRNYGVRMPLGKLINNKDFKATYGGLNYNEYIVYDESQVALRYLVQFRR